MNIYDKLGLNIKGNLYNSPTFLRKKGGTYMYAFVDCLAAGVSVFVFVLSSLLSDPPKLF